MLSTNEVAKVCIKHGLFQVEIPETGENQGKILLVLNFINVSEQLRILELFPKLPQLYLLSLKNFVTKKLLMGGG